MFRPKRTFITRQFRKETCPACGGTGQVLHNGVWDFGWKPCTACKGTGQIEVPIIPER